MADKYEELREHSTSAPNYDLTTDAIIAKLEEWDAEFGVSVSDVQEDCFLVQFQRLPADVTDLAREIYAFCPDIIDQGLEHFPEMLESDDMEPEVLEDMQQLAEGIDFDDPSFGFELLKKSIERDQQIGLWWD